MSIGPSGIYNHTVLSQPVPSFCSTDSEEALQIYKTDFQPGGKGEFVNGDGSCCNILMGATQFANVGLLAHIVANGDPKIINMRDSLGRTALHHLVHRAADLASTKKVMACALILIQAGAEIDTRHCLGPVAEPTFEEKNLVGENALGYLIRMASDIRNSEVGRKRCVTLMQLFLMHGSTECHTMIHESISSFSVDDPVNEEDKSMRATCIRILRKLRAKNLDWEKTRLLFLGQRDARSSLSGLPLDVLKLIHQKKTLMALTE